MNQSTSTDTSLSSSSGLPADTISRRAYELWEQEGRPEGSDLRHWLQAEQELRGQTGSHSLEAGRNERQDQARQQATDSRPLQGTRAGAAANREPKRSSRSPFGSDKSSATTAGAKPELTGTGRRRN